MLGLMLVVDSRSRSVIQSGSLDCRPSIFWPHPFDVHTFTVHRSVFHCHPLNNIDIGRRGTSQRKSALFPGQAVHLPTRVPSYRVNFELRSETDPTVENLLSAFHFESGKFLSFHDDLWMHKVAVICKYYLMTAEFETTPTV